MADSDERAGLDAFARDVRAGLQQPQKVIPARWLYDRPGSELFEAITDLPEYYPTRTEVALLASCATQVAAAIAPASPAVIEFGAGSAIKTPALLRALGTRHYVPVDISADFLMQTARRLETEIPGLHVHPVAADFTRAFPLPAAVQGQPLMGFFPGSTIGNLAPAAAVDLLRAWARLLGAGAYLLIGFDLAKPVPILEAAYDDAAGITAAFNLNLITRLNLELDANIDPTIFRHRARWNAAASRIEMHLEALADVQFTAAGIQVQMHAGETIHTENSHKWQPEAIAMMARASHWTPITQWQDPNQWFTLQLWQTTPPALEP